MRKCYVVIMANDLLRFFFLDQKNKSDLSLNFTLSFAQHIEKFCPLISYQGTREMVQEKRICHIK